MKPVILRNPKAVPNRIEKINLNQKILSSLLSLDKLSESKFSEVSFSMIKYSYSYRGETY